MSGPQVNSLGFEARPRLLGEGDSPPHHEQVAALRQVVPANPHDNLRGSYRSDLVVASDRNPV